MIAALQPCSFIDFDGHLAAVLFTQGCNLRCRYCHNPQLCAPTGDTTISFDEVIEFLASRSGKLTGVVVSGGEPSLHPELPRLLEMIVAAGFATKLDTNGLKPDAVLRIASDQLVDYVAVDVKLAPGMPSSWLCGADRQPESALQTLRGVVAEGVRCEARTTVVRELHDESILSMIARELASAGVGAWRLQPMRVSTVLDPTAKLSPPEPSTLAFAADVAASLGVEVVSRRSTNCYTSLYAGTRNAERQSS